MNSPVLEAKHLGISFGGLRAVSDFNLTLMPNELVGLIGPNGAGKTTVFNLLTGVYRPTEGAVYIGGKPQTGKKTHQLVKAGIARTFQNIRLFGEMSVIDNVKVALSCGRGYSLGAALFRLPRYWREEKEITARALELLSVFSLDGLMENEAKSLSYGQQRKLEIARALGAGARALLLDEPAAGMNPTETQELMNTIATIRERFNIAIILIEHDMSLVMKICERLVVLDYGEILATGTPAEIADNPKVIGAYLGE